MNTCKAFLWCHLLKLFIYFCSRKNWLTIKLQLQSTMKMQIFSSSSGQNMRRFLWTFLHVWTVLKKSRIHQNVCKLFFIGSNHMHFFWRKILLLLTSCLKKSHELLFCLFNSGLIPLDFVSLSSVIPSYTSLWI